MFFSRNNQVFEFFLKGLQSENGLLMHSWASRLMMWWCLVQDNNCPDLAVFMTVCKINLDLTLSAKARLTGRQQRSASAGEFQEEAFQAQMSLWRRLLESALFALHLGDAFSLQTCISALTQTSVNKAFQSDVSSTVKDRQWNLILGFCSDKGIFTKALF